MIAQGLHLLPGERDALYTLLSDRLAEIEVSAIVARGRKDRRQAARLAREAATTVVPLMLKLEHLRDQDLDEEAD